MLEFFKRSHISKSIEFEKIRYRKLKSISNILQNKIFILKIRSTLNNLYVTISNNFGQVILASSGGLTKITSSKRNTNYNLELILLIVIKKLQNLNIKNLFLNLDFLSLRKKKVITKILQKFQIKILGVQLNHIKAFNGIRLSKKRRI